MPTNFSKLRFLWLSLGVLVLALSACRSSEEETSKSPNLPRASVSGEAREVVSGPVTTASGTAASGARAEELPEASPKLKKASSHFGTVIVGGEEVAVPFALINHRSKEGYNGERERSWFEPARVLPSQPAPGCNTAKRYGVRKAKGMSPQLVRRIEAAGWDRSSLKERITQFVLHYDVCGTSRRCFEVLHDVRGLSVHFLLDIDGTLYQTMDLERRARHAGLANDRSIGIEIAHIGAYESEQGDWRRFYGAPDTAGRRPLTVPAALGPPPGRFRTARPGLFRGRIHGREYLQFDYSEAQYRTLRKLIAWLSTEFPKLESKTVTDANGAHHYEVLPPNELARFQGVLGHYHVSKSKIDPGPAFDWGRVLKPLDGNQELMTSD